MKEVLQYKQHTSQEKHTVSKASESARQHAASAMVRVPAVKAAIYPPEARLGGVADPNGGKALTEPL